ncbi:MAG: XRE family transcriptional regulator [Proteobacteria bacterium]|nr:XRE family transcriptional regulator [Pseudomonadota bacterium]
MKDQTSRIISQVAKRFKELRKANGLSHARLAERAKVTRPALSHIESGKRKPSLQMALKIAQALGVRLSDVLKDVE